MTEPVRCLVWDLDNTLWRGTLLEGDTCALQPGVRDVLERLDSRGILMSIASMNDADQAMPVLRRHGLDQLFLTPRIGWTNKVQSVRTIAESLGLRLSTVAFIDDEPFERAQMRGMLPPVRTYEAAAYRTLPDLPEFQVTAVTNESRSRRIAYRGTLHRAEVERRSGLPHHVFLASCRSQMHVRPADPGDIPRILELLRRAHQLNATGLVMDTATLRAHFVDPASHIFIATLKDRFVDYGRIGVAVCRATGSTWHLLAFLLSCRVLGRGLANCFLGWVEREAHRDGATVVSGRYRASGRNDRMARLFRLAGYRPTGRLGDIELYEKPPRARLITPAWLSVREPEEVFG